LPHITTCRSKVRKKEGEGGEETAGGSDGRRKGTDHIDLLKGVRRKRKLGALGRKLPTI